MWSRPKFAVSEVDRIGELAVKFFEHFEAEYYQYDKYRAGVCKLTVHTLFHLKETIERVGPPVNYSQFWVERFIEFNKSRLNARAKAGESMTQNALLLEG